MSTEKTAPQNTRARSAEGKLKIDEAAAIKQPAIDKIEVTSLQIDEAYEVDCDPYNCTGQFLVDALKQKYDD